MSEMKIDDGGPAFPSGKSESPGYENSLPYFQGMTMRDYFAAAALSGCLHHGIKIWIDAHMEGQNEVVLFWQESIAKSAVQIADAMLAELSRKDSET